MSKLLRLTLLHFLMLLPLADSVYAENVYSVGVVPQFETRRVVEIWQPIIDEISELSGIQLKLETSSSIPVFESELTNGNYDFAYMNPYHAIRANKKHGYEPIVRDVGRSLYGIIVVKKDSPIQSVKDLDGKTVAFPAPNALGASLMPRAEFARKFNIKIDEVYVQSHSSVYLNVLLGRSAAGGGVQKTLSQQPENIRDNLRVLHKTNKVNPHPLAVHPRIDEITRNKITKAFMDLGNNEKGKKLLNKIPMKKIGEANMGDYHQLEEMGLDDFYVRN